MILQNETMKDSLLKLAAAIAAVILVFNLQAAQAADEIAATNSSALRLAAIFVRSGFGLYHGDGQLDDQNVPIKNEVGVYSLSAKSTPGLSYPISPFLTGRALNRRMPTTATARRST